MKMPHLKLQSRILIGYAVPGIIAVGVATGVAIGVWRTTLLERELAQQNDVATGMQNAAFKLAVNQRLTRGNVIAQGGDGTRLEDFRANTRIIQEFIRQADQNIHNPTQKAKLAEIQTLVEAVLTLEDEINVQVMSNQMNEAIQAIAGHDATSSQTRVLSKQLDTLIAEFQVQQAEVVASHEERLSNALKLLTLMTVLAALISVGASGLLGMAIATRITSSIQQTVEDVDLAASRICDAVLQQEQAIAQQASAMHQTTSTIVFLQTASQQVAHQAEVSAQGTQETLELVCDGTQTVQAAEQSIQALEQQVLAIITEIQHLTQQTQEVSVISQLVEDISAQTHLLALNAAIEAARLGQQGASFAIIAQQIRALASQSRVSAEKIGGFAHTIQHAISHTDVTSDQGKTKAGIGVDLTQRTAQAFQAIAGAIDQITLSSQKIAQDNQQQSQGMEQVTNSMQVLNQGAQDIVASTHQINASTQTLANAIHTLKAQI